MGKVPVCCPSCKSTDWEIVYEDKKSTGLTHDFDRRAFLSPKVVPVGISVKTRKVYRCRKCGFSRSYDV